MATKNSDTNPHDNRPRTVKLSCPSLSKIVTFLAWEEQRLDLGAIARAFGLDPSTLKLNGHFISRGVDLVSSSVTWRSLLRFFSAKGLSTGKDDEDALVVDGKLSKVGTKRGHEPQDSVTGVQTELEDAYVSVNRRPHDKDISSLMNKKLKENKSGCQEAGHMSNWNGIGFKRKQLLEDLNLLKKLKINETISDSGGCQRPCVSSSKRLTCCYLSDNMKRMREDEIIHSASCKRIR